MNRRKFLRNIAIGTAGTVAACGGLSLAAAGANQAYALQVVQQRITLPNLGPGLNGLRAVQISDLHMGGFIQRDFLEKVLKLVLDQQPDIVFITGDFVYYHADIARGVRDLQDTLGMLTQKVPVYAVLGNHDYVAWNELQAIFKKYGIRELWNAVEPIHKNGDTLYLAGVGSVSLGREDLDKIVKDTPDDVPAILMCHEPDWADISGPTGKFALQISGHSHGGQINLPIAGRLVLPTLAKKYPSGLYKVGNMLQYTNRGIGMIHVPVRFDCTPEITVFTFVSS